MSKKNLVKTVLDHPDRDEIISKLIIGSSSSDIHEWLKAKYTNIGERKFVITEKNIEIFKDNYLDIYNHLKEHIDQVKESKNTYSEENLDIVIKNNKHYKQRLKELVDQEIDIKLTIKNLIAIIEMRMEQVFDNIQQNPESIGKGDYVLIQYLNTLSSNVDKLNKILNDAPDQVIQHNVTLQVLDQHILIFQEAIKETLSKLDIQTSLEFMDILTEKLKKLNPPVTAEPLKTEERMAEVKILGEKIIKSTDF